MTDLVMLTPAEVAERLNVSVHFVYKLCRNEQMGCHHFGRSLGIPEPELDAYLERTFVPAAVAVPVTSIDEHRLRSVQAA